jgi:predicted NBD/HSP70 family sugar kinase
MRDARQAALEGRWHSPNPDGFTYTDVVRAAGDGSEALRQLFARAGHILGIGISHLIALFNPKKIVITGQGVQAGALIFTDMHAALDRHVSAKFGHRKVEIVVREWTEQDWARGAGAMVLQELYKSPVGQVATHH